jgi:hypothetical protein
MDTIPSAILEEAELKASGWASIALVAQMSPAAHAQLEACGLDAAHAAMPANDLLPLLREMVFARTIGKSEHALRLKPAEPAGQRMLRPPTVATAVDGMGTVPALVHLVVARFQEDVSWLNRLPDSVSYIVLQKHALQPEVPSERQELLPNVGRESHSYLSYFLSCVNGQRSALPPTLVCCQADPFDHNPNFLSDIAALVMHAAAKQCSAYPAEEASRGEEASAADATQTATPLRLPRFVPLGVWKGGERWIWSDASGAPHQAKLVPIAQTWRRLFGESRPVPLWLSFTPGACFAVDTSLVLSRPARLFEAALEGGLRERVDPIEGHAFERLWLYLLLDDAEASDTVAEAPQWFS